MIGELLKSQTVNTWSFLNINEKILREHYRPVKISLPTIDLQYPWAVRNDIQRLFLLCIALKSKKEVLSWIKKNSDITLNQIHINLIDLFCCSKSLPTTHLDELIEESDDFFLLNFIHSMLERALLWYDPEPTWPSDFFYILRNSKLIIDSVNQSELITTESIKTIGVDFISTDEHTHILYKFQNICLQLNEDLIYSEIKTIAKQAHAALLQSINLFLEERILIVDDIKFERKLDYLINQENVWCVALIDKQNSSTC